MPLLGDKRHLMAWHQTYKFAKLNNSTLLSYKQYIYATFTFFSFENTL